MKPIEVLSIDLSADTGRLPECHEAVLNAGLRLGLAKEDAENMAGAVFEACVNAVTYGRSCPMSLDVKRYADRLEAVVRDAGEGFSGPGDVSVPPPTQRRGRGIPLMPISANLTGRFGFNLTDLSERKRRWTL